MCVSSYRVSEEDVLDGAVVADPTVPPVPKRPTVPPHPTRPLPLLSPLPSIDPGSTSRLASKQEQVIKITFLYLYL